MTSPQTLFEKVWQRHVVVPPEAPGMPTVLAIDLHLIHEVTSPQAFAMLDERKLKVRKPFQTVGTMDHSIPTHPDISRARWSAMDAIGAKQLERLEENCKRHGVPLHAIGSADQGIVHVMGPDLGLTQPGFTIVCGDSHTSTHGAFGAFAFGIGTTEVGHVLATQCLLQHKPKTFEVRIDGEVGLGVTAKDLILAVIAENGVQGGTGHVFEYTGAAIRALSMEGRLTVCNMSIEGGARAGMIAPDETTFDYLEGRAHAPQGAAWEEAKRDWRSLASDPDATNDRQLVLDAVTIEPMITYGTNPGMAIPITGSIPEPGECSSEDRPTMEKALEYMALEAGQPILDQPIDVVFLGSCTNSRYSDLAAAAKVLDGKKIHSGLRMLVVPGSVAVKQQAEQDGLHEVFLAAGAEWREAGCSMCLAMNNDKVGAGEYAVSTSNRNFEGRQGPGSRTFLASPLTAAASAIAGRVADVREIL